MSLLRQEIDEQPAVLQRLLDEQQEQVDKIAKVIQEFDPAFISIAARGTSDNAARYAKYVFGKGCGLATTLAAPSLHTIYESPPNLSKALVIGISQSGQAEDVRTVLENARNQGACTLAITNFDDSPMAQTAEYHLSLLAGEELSIAATKTYTAQLMNIAMLAASMIGKTELKDELKKIPKQAQQTLDL
ncbi:MAG: SIS domain-containing protein, partial [Aggregatilineales bacterium]